MYITLVTHLNKFAEKIEHYTGYKSTPKEKTEAKPEQPIKEVNIKPDNKEVNTEPDKEINIKPENKKVKPVRNRNVSKLSLVVIGPLDQKRKVNTG